MVGIILKPWIGHKCGNVHNNRVFQIPYLNTLKLLIFPTLITFADCPSSSFKNSVCYFSRFCQVYFNVGHFNGLCHKIFSTSIMQADTYVEIFKTTTFRFLIPDHVSLNCSEGMKRRPLKPYFTANNLSTYCQYSPNTIFHPTLLDSGHISLRFWSRIHYHGGLDPGPLWAPFGSGSGSGE